MNGFVDIYTLIFLVLAVVIFFKLRSVLGQRTGNERPPFDPYSRTKTNEADAAAGDKVVALPRRPSANDDAAAPGEAVPRETAVASPRLSLSIKHDPPATQRQCARAQPSLKPSSRRIR